MTPITLPDNFFTRHDWDSQDLDVLGNSTKLIQETAEATKELATTVQAQGEAIEAEEAARKEADEAEAAARKEADEALEGKIQATQDNLDTEVTRAKDAEEALGGRIDAETKSREDADTALGERIDATNEALTAETERATQAEATLTQATADNKTAIEAEATRATEAEAALGGRIDATNEALATETSERKGADTTLQGNIDAEAASREAADTALSSRVSTLESNVIWRDSYTFASVPAGATQTYAFQLDIKYADISEIAPYVVTTSPLAYPYVVLVQTDALTVGVRNLSEEDLENVTVYAQTAGRV